jgi:hypothetical protein
MADQAESSAFERPVREPRHNVASVGQPAEKLELTFV